MKLCVALSGGVDSVCLLHYLHVHGTEYAIALSAAHLEHGIRGEESLRDLKFCKELCAAWGITLYTRHADIPAIASERGEGIEEAARRERYAFFQDLTDTQNIDAVATAHHMGDVAETVLFRLARGTSPAGMRTIAEREGVVRPLLHVTRAEIEAYAKEHGLSHVEDSTNADERYARNLIRHTVLPALGQVCGQTVEHLMQFASLSAGDDDFLQKMAAEQVIHREGELLVPIGLPQPLFARACMQIMRGESFDYTGGALMEIMRLKELQSGRSVTLSGSRIATREGKYIVFFSPHVAFEGEIPFTAGESAYTEPKPFCVTTNEIKGRLRVDLDAFPKNCVVRTRREGDYITPYGGRRKSLKKFLGDRKISARLGHELALIACGAEILVVVGVEIADSVKVTEHTVRCGYIG